MEKIEDHQKVKQNQNYSFTIILTIISALGGFLFGYDTGIIGSANLYIYDDLGNDETFILELVVSFAIIGAAIGSFASGPISDNFGRRKALLVSDILFTAGALIMGLAPNVWVLMGGRFITGLGIGSAAMSVPVYIAECAPSEIRGSLVTTNIFLVTIGLVVSYILGYVLDENWRLMLGLAGIPSVVQGFALIFMPETPRWLYKEKRNEEALETLLKIRLKKEYRDEIYLNEEIEGILQNISEEGNLTYSQQIKILFISWRKAAKLGIGLQIFEELCGINTILYYGPEVFEETGLSDSEKDSILALLPAAIANMIGCAIAIYLVEKLGRRNSALYTLPGMFIFMVGISFTFYFIEFEEEDSASYWTVIFVMLFVFSFSLSMGTMPWVVNSEIYPVFFIELNIRSMGNSVSTTMNWVANVVVSLTFASFLDFSIGKMVVWLVIACFVGFTWVFVYYRLPETKGKSLERLAYIFKTERLEETNNLLENN